MARRYLWKLFAFGFAFCCWEARAEDIQAQIEALIDLEDKVKGEYDHLLRSKSALDCLNGEQLQELTCFARRELGIKVFGTCRTGENCKVQVDLGSGQRDSVALMKPDTSDKDNPIALNQCGAFRRQQHGSRCSCNTVISLKISKGSALSITKVELHMKNSDAAWQKIFASAASGDKIRITNRAIRNNATFKAAEGGVCR